jgi:hypothetical protein
MNVTRTRISFGAQLREALDTLEAGGQIKKWSTAVEQAGALRYVVDGVIYTPGAVAAQLNAWHPQSPGSPEGGFDIRVGKDDYISTTDFPGNDV